MAGGHCYPLTAKYYGTVLSQVDRTACWHREVLETAKSNLTAAQKKQKQHYERKCSKPGAYQVGTKVLMKDFTRKKKGVKLDPKWLGPYSITKCLGKGLYMLKADDNPRVVVSRVNGAHIKPYSIPPPSPTNNRSSSVQTQTTAPYSIHSVK